MPPKVKFTREDILRAALEMVREGGIDSITARNLGARLGVSARPIFTAFENMDELKREVIKIAEDLHEEYLKNAMQGDKYPAYKANGMAYILFAKEERELFKLLFMRDRSGETQGKNGRETDLMIEIIRKDLGITHDAARKLHLEMWVYVHGIATMIVTNYLDWSMDFASEALSDVYQGLLLRYKQNV